MFQNISDGFEAILMHFLPSFRNFLIGGFINSQCINRKAVLTLNMVCLVGFPQ